MNNKITYSDAVQLLNTIILEGLQSVSAGKYINAEKCFIKAVRLSRQLGKIKRHDDKVNALKNLQQENEKLKKQLKEAEKDQNKI